MQADFHKNYDEQRVRKVNEIYKFYHLKLLLAVRIQGWHFYWAVAAPCEPGFSSSSVVDNFGLKDLPNDKQIGGSIKQNGM